MESYRLRNKTVEKYIANILFLCFKPYKMTDSVNFKGIHYAQCKGLAKNGEAQIIDFYKITQKDRKLIDRIAHVKHKDTEIPLEISVGLGRRLTENRDVFIAVCENKPIGIIGGKACKKDSNGERFCYVSGFATWGKDKQLLSRERINKIKNAGKGLMTVLFDSANKRNINTIELFPINDSAKFYTKNEFHFINPDLSGGNSPNIAKEMKCQLTPNIFSKNVEDLEMSFTYSNKDVSLDHLDASFTTSGLKDYLKHNIALLKKTIKNISQKPSN